MLLSDLSTGYVIFVVLFTIYAAFLAFYQQRLANFCRDAVMTVLNQNKRAVSLRRMAEVEATLTDLADSYDALLKAHKTLRSRIGMRHVRDQKIANGIETIPDSTADPAGYKRAMRLRLRSEGKIQ